MPIVHSRAAKGFFIQRETQRFNQMQPRPGRQTQPGYIASVGWDFRLNKYDMQHWKSMQRCIVPGNWIPAETFHVEQFLKSPKGETWLTSQGRSQANQTRHNPF
jgi:hypothetical protein